MAVRFQGKILPRGSIRVTRGPVFINDLPVFTTQPSITPTAGFTGDLLTASDGTVDSGTITGRVWRRNGVAIPGATGTTFTTTQEGSYSIAVTATNSAGSQVAISNTSEIAERPAPPEFTSPPSISPLNAAMGTTFTGNDGTFTGGTVTSRQWLIGGVPIQGATNSTYISDRLGQLTYRVTVSGPLESATQTSDPATITINPSLYNPPVWNSAGYLGSYPEFEAVSIQLDIDDPENNVDAVTLLSGTMPAGLTVDSTGLISGTIENVPETTNYSFTLRATDRTGLTADSSFSMQVQNVSSVVVWNTPEGEIADVGVGGNVDQQLSATSQP